MKAGDRFQRREEEGRVGGGFERQHRPMTVPGCSAAGLAFGLMMLVMGTHLSLKASARRRWPSVEGVVTGGRVESGYSGQGSLIKHFPVVEYRYKVGGTTYSADTVSVPRAWHSSRESAEKFVRKHPPGTKVTVRYNPETPGEAALDILPDVVSWLLVRGGAVFAGVGGLVLGVIMYQKYAGRRRQRERTRRRD